MYIDLIMNSLMVNSDRLSIALLLLILVGVVFWAYMQDDDDHYFW